MQKPPRRNWPLLLIYAAIAIGGVLLVAGFLRFNELHREFLAINHSTASGGRTLLKTRFFVDKAADDIDAALLAPERMPPLLASASRHLLGAQTYASEGHDDDPELRHKLSMRIQEMRANLDRLASGPSGSIDLGTFPSELHSLAHEIGNAERERWNVLSTLNGELTAGMRTMNLLIGAAFVLFVAIMLALGQVLNRALRAEAGLKQAKEETEAIQQATLDASPIGIAFVDGATTEPPRILTANRQMAAIFGYETGRLSGLGLKELFAEPEAHAEFVRMAASQLASGDVIGQEAVMLRREGTRFWCALSAKAIDPADPERGIVLTCEDVSPRKAVIAELEEEHRRAEAASQAKSDFLANMSHELRTPFAGLFGLIGLLEHSPLDDRQRRHLQLARDSASQMQAIVNDILDFSKIEAGKLIIDASVFDLRWLLQTTAEIHAMAATRKGLHFSTDFQPAETHYVVGDPVRLRQILDNLLSNAVKFTEHGEIRMAARMRRLGERIHLNVVIEDTGIGIPREMQDRIFEKFTQGDSSTTRLYGGTGLGLAISRQLATMMGGRIAVSSREGTGSRFSLSLRLPAASPSELPPPEADEKIGRLDGIVVLLAEDHPTNRTMLAETLIERGAIVHVAENGEEAVRLATEYRPDAILMDCQMPRIDGLEATRRIRAAGDRVPVIALTAFATLNIRDDCLAAGMNSFLTKPVTPKLLCNEILRLLGAPAGDERTPAPATEQPPALSGRILLVDDNPPILEATRALIERSGCRVEISGSGSDALARLQAAAEVDDEAQSFDLVLLDCHMPVLDGLETTRRWRALERERHWPRLPIVALTADDHGTAQARCRAAGMDGVLTKPFTEGELRSLLTEWLA